tara:strand:- start:6617 stop:7168 length:552 start_codon:yes stop_codon:yes gene_type:complete
MILLQKLLLRVRVTLHQLRLRLLVQNRAVTFAPGCSITTGVRIRATDGAHATFGERVTVDRFADIIAKYGELSIGAGTYIGQFTVICTRDKITIGTNCLIAEHVTLRDQDHNFGAGVETIEAGFTTAPVEIGNNVWIGAKATITKGVKIGNNSVVGANSVVTRDVPPDTVVAGSPACILRKTQ